MKKYKVALQEKERELLEAIVWEGNHKSPKILNALVLLNCNEGQFQDHRNKNKDVASVLRISMRRIDRVKKRFVEEGLETALNGHKRRHLHEKRAGSEFEARLIALNCTAPPEGSTRWSVRLLADRVVKLGYIDSISRETVRQLLKKQKMKP